MKLKADNKSTFYLKSSSTLGYAKIHNYTSSYPPNSSNTSNWGSGTNPYNNELYNQGYKQTNNPNFTVSTYPYGVFYDLIDITDKTDCYLQVFDYGNNNLLRAIKIKNSDILTFSTGIFVKIIDYLTDIASYEEFAESNVYIVTWLNTLNGTPTDNINIIIDNVTPSTDTTISITGTLTNCTCNFANGATVVNGDVITITPNTGYHFAGDENFPIVLPDNTDDTFYFDNGVYKYDVVSADLIAGASYKLTGTYSAIRDVTPTTTTISITGTLTNCTCNFANGATVVNGDVITITPNTGYHFDSSENYSIVLPDGSDDTFYFESGLLKYNVISADLIAGASYVLNGVYEAVTDEPIPTDIIPFTNIYNPNEEQLNRLAGQRFVTIGGETVDHGQYITNLYYIPYGNLPLKQDTELIKLGTNTTNVRTKALNTYRMFVNFGTITIPLIYNNVYDYINTDCILHIPHFKNINIESDLVIGKTITVKGYINLYDGNMTILVYNDNIEVLQETGDINLIIPFINMITKQTFTNNEPRYYFQNEINKMYIEVKRNIPYTANKFSRNVELTTTLNTLTGFTKCVNVKLNTLATKEEKDKIIDLLKSGVIL